MTSRQIQYQLYEIEDLLRQGLFEQAEQRLGAIKQSKLDAVGHGQFNAMRIACLAGPGRRQERQQEIDRVLADRRKPHWFRLAFGSTFTEVGYPHHGEYVLEQLREQTPRDPMVLYNLALAKQHCGKLEESVDLYAQMSEIKPDAPMAPFNRALILHRMGEPEPAAESLRTYLELEPDDAEAWMLRGILESELGDCDQAFAGFQQAERLDPTITSLHFNWAMTAVRCQDREQLQYCVDKLEQQREHAWQAPLVRAHLAVMDENRDKAWSELKTAYDMIEHDPHAEQAQEAGIIVSMLLRFAMYDDGIQEHARPLIDEIYERDFYVHESVLDALREIDGRRIRRGTVYRAVLSGLVTNEDAKRTFLRGREPSCDIPYMRGYAVIAEDETEARDEMLSFERRIGPEAEIEVEQIEYADDVEDEYTGVAQVSPVYSFEALTEGEDVPEMFKGEDPHSKWRPIGDI